MKRFAQLYADLDASTSTARKCGHIVNYLREAEAADAAWAVFFLMGGRVRRIVPTRLLRQAACEMARIDDWLFDQSYQAVGDLGETIALLLPLPSESLSLGLAACVETRVLPLRGRNESDAMAAICELWTQMQPQERFLFVKWVGGGLRVGVSRALVIRALSQLTGLDARILAQRIIAFAQLSQPAADDWRRLVCSDGDEVAHGMSDLLPYPFFLAHPLADEVSSLGPADDWQAEWKYDGIRAQIVKRGGAVNIWSRGEELINDAFPELLEMTEHWPDGCVLDGEILVQQTADTHGDTADAAGFSDNIRPAPFASLQVRLNRKRVDAALRKTHPVMFVAYDLLEQGGTDMRRIPQWQRRQWLEDFVRQQGFNSGDAEASIVADRIELAPTRSANSPVAATNPLRLAPLVSFDDWTALTEIRLESRARGVEGLMLKARNSMYGVGRTRTEGVWLKWKIEPMSIDAVLVYAQAGHGRRASLYTDYTFAVWDRQPTAEDVQRLCEELKTRGAVPSPDLPQLVTFAKAYSGLSDEEFKRVDKNIRQTLLEKFGPVRRVVPSMVFEIGFEGIAASSRHKSGVAVRFPRMLRIRDDKPLEQASTLADLRALLELRS